MLYVTIIIDWNWYWY